MAPEDAGAASGLVNVAHQLGGSLGLAVLVTVFAAAAPAGVVSPATLAHQIGTALTAGAAMLALAFVVVTVVIARPGRTAQLAVAPVESAHELEVFVEAA